MSAKKEYEKIEKETKGMREKLYNPKVALHEKHESKSQEKKEHMARKLYATGRGTKKKVLEGLEEMAKHPSLKHYRDGDTHIRKGEGITRRDIYRD